MRYAKVLSSMILVVGLFGCSGSKQPAEPPARGGEQGSIPPTPLAPPAGGLVKITLETGMSLVGLLVEEGEETVVLRTEVGAVSLPRKRIAEIGEWSFPPVISQEAGEDQGKPAGATEPEKAEPPKAQYPENVLIPVD